MIFTLKRSTPYAYIVDSQLSFSLLHASARRLGRSCWVHRGGRSGAHLAPRWLRPFSAWWQRVSRNRGEGRSGRLESLSVETWREIQQKQEEVTSGLASRRCSLAAPRLCCQHMLLERASKTCLATAHHPDLAAGSVRTSWSQHKQLDMSLPKLMATYTLSWCKGE